MKMFIIIIYGGIKYSVVRIVLVVLCTMVRGRSVTVRIISVNLTATEKNSSDQNQLYPMNPIIGRDRTKVLLSLTANSVRACATISVQLTLTG